MLHHVAMGEGDIRPLRISLTVPVGVDEVLCKEVTLQHVLLVLLGIQHRGNLCEGLVRPLEVVGDLTHTCLTLLGGDKHDTITCFSTVDSGRSSVFQNFHRSDHIGIETTDVTCTDTINNVKRLGTYIRGITTHTYGG